MTEKQMTIQLLSSDNKFYVKLNSMLFIVKEKIVEQIKLKEGLDIVRVENIKDLK